MFGLSTSCPAPLDEAGLFGPEEPGLPAAPAADAVAAADDLPAGVGGVVEADFGVEALAEAAVPDAAGLEGVATGGTLPPEEEAEGVTALGPDLASIVPLADEDAGAERNAIEQPSFRLPVVAGGHLKHVRARSIGLGGPGEPGPTRKAGSEDDKVFNPASDLSDRGRRWSRARYDQHSKAPTSVKCTDAVCG